MEKIPTPLEKRCEQCQEVKPIEEFYRTKNGRDGYMKNCVVCHKGNLQQSREAQQAEYEHLKREREEREQEEREHIEAQRAEREDRYEKHLREQTATLEAWFADQPARICKACGQEKVAIEFGYSELITQENGFWVPAQLHQRCKPCHELMREKQQIPCVLCGQGMRNVLMRFDDYHLYGGGTKINLCCLSCQPAFQALPKAKQRFYIRARVNLAFPSSQVIYAEVDPLTREKRYIGRTKHAARRHSQHKLNIHAERPILRFYDWKKEQYVETAWYSRANWMYDLAQQGFSPKQHILLDVQPAAYVIEYETRYILHAIQQGWPILNVEAQRPSAEQVRSSTLDFLHASFADLVDDGWFMRDGIESFIRAWYVQ